MKELSLDEKDKAINTYRRHSDRIRSLSSWHRCQRNLRYAEELLEVGIPEMRRDIPERMHAGLELDLKLIEAGCKFQIDYLKRNLKENKN